MISPGTVRLAIPPHTRASLLLRLKNRDDEAAWEEFVEIYQPILYRMARSRGHQDADAREIIQEVMIAVAKHIEHFEPNRSSGAFRAWLSTIVRTKAINLLTRHGKLQSVGGTEFSRQLQQHIDPQISAQHEFELEHRKQLFLWAAEKVRDAVTAATWQAFWLSCVQDQSPSSVASQLNLSVGSVYVARSRVIARMRALINEHQLHGDQP